MADAVLNYPVKDINYMHFSVIILFAQYRFFTFMLMIPSKLFFLLL